MISVAKSSIGPANHETRIRVVNEETDLSLIVTSPR